MLAADGVMLSEATGEVGSCCARRTQNKMRQHLVLNVHRVLMVHSAAYGFAGSQDFFDSACQFAGTAAIPHDSGDFDDVIQAQVACVLDVLLLRGGTGQASLPQVLQIQYVALLSDGNNQIATNAAHGRLVAICISTEEVEADQHLLPVSCGLLEGLDDEGRC